MTQRTPQPFLFRPPALVAALLALLLASTACHNTPRGIPMATSGSGGKGITTAGSGGDMANGSSGNGGSGNGSATSSAAGQPGTGGAAAEPAVRFVGRTDTSEPGVTQFSWSGSSIQFRFSGSQAAVRLDDQAGYFTLLVDGVLQPRLETTPGAKLYPVATNLAAGEHEIKLYRRTEGSFGVTRFLGVELEGGKLLTPPAAAARRIEIIGDSISCGYGNEGADEHCNFSGSTENHYLTYGAIAARNLEADLITVAWSGKGVIFNYGSDKNEPLPTLYQRVLATNAAPLWNFASWQPDVVIINLGTNDYSTGGDPSDTQFTDAYVTFLATIRSKNPNAYILCLLPTGLSGNDFATAKKNIEAAVNQRQQAGDKNLGSYALPASIIDWGCDYHPGDQTHAAMGAALTSELKTRMGW